MVNVQFIDPRILWFSYALVLTLASVWLWCSLGKSWKAMSKVAGLGFVWFLCTGAIVQSGATTDLWTIDTTSKAGRTTTYDTTGRDVSLQSKQTFACSNTFTPAATPTDLITVTGSATKTVRVISVTVSTTNTAAGSQQFFVIKRSTADTTGTFVTSTNVPLDSANAAGTAVCGHYTANAGALGTAVGTINTLRVASPVAVPGSFAGVVQDAGMPVLSWFPASLLDQPVVLRGVNQQLAVNFGGAALVAGQTHAYNVVWIEE